MAKRMNPTQKKTGVTVDSDTGLLRIPSEGPMPKPVNPKELQKSKERNFIRKYPTKSI